MKYFMMFIGIIVMYRVLDWKIFPNDADTPRGVISDYVFALALILCIAIHDIRKDLKEIKNK